MKIPRIKLYKETRETIPYILTGVLIATCSILLLQATDVAEPKDIGAAAVLSLLVYEALVFVGVIALVQIIIHFSGRRKY